MFYVKKLIMHGFKSFPRKTELFFDEGINVILGPNGSGKSNISDALCFVLGRTSTKSMRAAKAGNLIFLGSKSISSSKEAVVELVFDNSEKILSVDSDEVSIKRIVRKSGQSIYKINNETKTRQEILSLLSQAGIDPMGFNIVLQGQIQNFVRMHSDERRKIIEEVSGISIYELRKEKSLKELEKTDNKLKEVSAILRERTIYLNNLEKERQQALRFKKLQEDVKIFKASIINQDLNYKEKEQNKIDSQISDREKKTEKIKKSIINSEAFVRDYELKINKINTTIQESTGLEQEKLNKEIADIRAELAGTNVRLDNHENRLSETIKQKKELEKRTEENKISVKDLKKQSSISKKEKDIDSKRQELDKLEKQRKIFYMTKSELKSLKDRLEDKKSSLQGYNNESDFLVKQIQTISKDLFDKKTDNHKVEILKLSLNENKDLIENLNKREKELEKITFSNDAEIDKQKELIDKVSKMDICPLCKSKITEGHIDGIHKETNRKIDSLKNRTEKSDKELNEISQKRDILKQNMEQLTSEISRRESDLIKLSGIEEKKEQIKILQERIGESKSEISEIEKEIKTLEKKFDENSNIEQLYENRRIEFQEIAVRSKENVGSEISYKERELERAKSQIKQLSDEEDDLKNEISDVKKDVEKKEIILNKKRKEEEELSRKFQSLISQRDDFQKKIREIQTELLTKQNETRNTEQEINNFKIEGAKTNAEIENLKEEMKEFSEVNIIRSNKKNLIQKLAKTQEVLAKIGSVNMRSLEVYDSVKKEYDAIHEKSQVIEKEKEDIMKIIHEIDIKKKKTFLKTLNVLNETFSRNFSNLSIKGNVSLELENKKAPFEEGINIIVKTGHGKYFDVTSLSGGEQTLVALSLIFAIQEYKPYYFYILDEIDAALDKRNSERLAGLLKKYMKKGQYIIVTHNDEIITSASNLYGVSMHEGVSKIVSLKL